MKTINIIKIIIIYLCLILVFAWVYIWPDTSHYKEGESNPAPQTYIYRRETKEDLLIKDIIINTFRKQGIDANYSNIDSLMDDQEKIWQEYYNRLSIVNKHKEASDSFESIESKIIGVIISGNCNQDTCLVFLGDSGRLIYQ